MHEVLRDGHPLAVQQVPDGVARLWDRRVDGGSGEPPYALVLVRRRRERWRIRCALVERGRCEKTVPEEVLFEKVLFEKLRS